MLVKGEIKCLHCGHISGEWVGVSGSALTMEGFKATGAQTRSGDASAAIHCQRCDGPVFLDDAGLVISSYRIRKIRRLRAQIAAYDAKRAGQAA